MHIFHKWEYYDRYEDDAFLGEKIERTHNKFRMCKVCQIVQEYWFDSQGGSWDTLSPDKQKIFYKVKSSKVVKY